MFVSISTSFAVPFIYINYDDLFMLSHYFRATSHPLHTLVIYSTKKIHTSSLLLSLTSQITDYQAICSHLLVLA